MNISPCQHKSGQMLEAVRQSLTWMLETFYARFPVSVNSYLYSRLRDRNGRAARIVEPKCLMPSK